MHNIHPFLTRNNQARIFLPFTSWRVKRWVMVSGSLNILPSLLPWHSPTIRSEVVLSDKLEHWRHYILQIPRKKLNLWKGTVSSSYLVLCLKRDNAERISWNSYHSCIADNVFLCIIGISQLIFGSHKKWNVFILWLN